MDDVPFLEANSDNASYLALVDSAQRDTRVWPTASEFQVVFDTPFTMVYGMDLLGVNVPRTEFTVGRSRNVLVLSYGEPGASQAHTVAVEEGDYTAVTFFAAINTALAACPSPAGNVVTALNASAVQSVDQRLVFSCAERFTLYMSRSSARVVVGFADPVRSGAPGYAADGWAPGAPDTVTSILTPQPGSPGLPACDGLADAVAPRPVTAGTPVRQAFQAGFAGIATGVRAAVAARGRVLTETLAWRVLSPDLSAVYSVGTIQVNLDQAVSAGTATECPLPLLAGAGYVVEVADPNNADGANCFTLAANVAVTVQQPVHTVAAPGLLDLTGERYIVLRCLEIESPTNKGRAFEKWTAGVGMITLGTFGYNVQSYDYSAYPPRTFQPIGSLAKLTLSFRKPDGSLYDFRGLNVQLLLLIRYYVPRTPAGRDTANPQYTPYLPQAVSRQLQEQVEWDPRYRWMPRLTGQSGRAPPSGPGRPPGASRA